MVLKTEFPVIVPISISVPYVKGKHNDGPFRGAFNIYDVKYSCNGKKASKNGKQEGITFEDGNQRP